MPCNFNGTWSITYSNSKGQDIIGGQIVISNGVGKTCRVEIKTVKNHSNVTSWTFESNAAGASLSGSEQIGGLNYSVTINFNSADSPTAITASTITRVGSGLPGIDDMGTFTGTKGW